MIFGHVLQIGSSYGDRMSELTWTWIYIFHMPLFVFISGYFSRKKNVKHYFSSCLKLLESLIIFQLIFLIKRYLSKEDLTIEMVFTPNWVLWYLLSLILWRTLLQYIPDKILRKRGVVVATAFIISLLSGFLPIGGLMSLQRTLAFLPFFFIGYYFKDKPLFISKRYRYYCVFVFVASFLVVFLKDYLGDLTQSKPYENLSGLLGVY